MATVTIIRDSCYADRLRAYHVVIDGIKIIKINNGQSIDVNVSSGEHELYLKIDWCRSNKLSFSINEDQQKHFNCGSSMRGFKLLFALIYITFLKNNYVWLKESSNNAFKRDAEKSPRPLT